MRRTGRLVLGFALIAAWGHASSIAAAQSFHITILSSRPDMVSGGDALARVDVPADVPLDQVAVKLNGHDVSGALHPDPTAHALTGLVTGLTGVPVQTPSI